MLSESMLPCCCASVPGSSLSPTCPGLSACGGAGVLVGAAVICCGVCCCVDCGPGWAGCCAGADCRAGVTGAPPAGCCCALAGGVVAAGGVGLPAMRRSIPLPVPTSKV